MDEATMLLWSCLVLRYSYVWGGEVNESLKSSLEPLKSISFVSLSDQDRMIETVSNKFAIIQISQPMNGSLIRKTE